VNGNQRRPEFLETLRRTPRLADLSGHLSAWCSTIDPDLISPGPGTSPRSFGCGCAGLIQSAGKPADSKGFAIDRTPGRRASVSECGGLPPLCCSELKNAQLSTFNGESTGEPMGQTIERHSQ